MQGETQMSSATSSPDPLAVEGPDGRDIDPPLLMALKLRKIIDKTLFECSRRLFPYSSPFQVDFRVRTIELVTERTSLRSLYSQDE